MQPVDRGPVVPAGDIKATLPLQRGSIPREQVPRDLARGQKAVPRSTHEAQSDKALLVDRRALAGVGKKNDFPAGALEPDKRIDGTIAGRLDDLARMLSTN